MDITYTLLFFPRTAKNIGNFYVFSVVTWYDSVIHNFATDSAKVISHYLIGRDEPSTIHLRINDVWGLFSLCEWNAFRLTDT